MKRYQISLANFTSGLLCFDDKPIKGNHTIVAEFYANDLDTNFGL